jgi:signal peptidase I
MQKDLRESALYKERFEIGSALGSVFTVLLAMLCLIVLWTSFWWRQNYSGVQVSGSSMYKTLNSGDWLLMKQVKDGEGFTYGDVIVIHVADYPEVQEYNKGKAEPMQYLIKRVIALAGDTVKCEREQLYIRYAGTDEFVKLDEPYAYYGRKSEIYDFDGYSYTVGEGEVFFLGDNRENSCDSRYQEYGGSHLEGRLYKAEDVVGVVPEWAITYKERLEPIFFWRQLREAKH